MMKFLGGHTEKQEKTRSIGQRELECDPCAPGFNLGQHTAKPRPPPQLRLRLPPPRPEEGHRSKKITHIACGEMYYDEGKILMGKRKANNPNHPNKWDISWRNTWRKATMAI